MLTQCMYIEGVLLAYELKKESEDSNIPDVLNDMEVSDPYAVNTWLPE